MFGRIITIFGAAFAAVIAEAIELKQDGYYVSPGENIQEAVELAARNPTNKTVKVLAGVYQPKAMRQATPPATCWTSTSACRCSRRSRRPR